MKKSNLAKDSLVVITNVVLPNKTNKFGHMFGGELLSRMDCACAIAVPKRWGGKVVTTAFNNLNFNKFIPLGSIVTIESKISCVFSTLDRGFCECLDGKHVTALVKSSTKISLHFCLYRPTRGSLKRYRS